MRIHDIPLKIAKIKKKIKTPKLTTPSTGEGVEQLKL